MRILAAAVLLFGLAGAAAAQQAPQALEDRVLEVARQLRCPVCQNLSVADSPSDLAREMRGVIREQLRAGKTPEEIKAYFVSKYGDWILLSPRPGGIGWLVWVGPFAGAAAGLLLAGLAIWRWSRRRRQAAPVVADPALVERACREALEEQDPVPDAMPRSPLETERSRLYATLRELEFDYRAGKLSVEDYNEMRRDCGIRAAAVLAALASAPVRPAAAAREPGSPSAAAAGPAAGRRRAWRLATGTVFLIVFGVVLIVFLSASLRPRMEGTGSPTGDFLTGTGPGGISPDSAEAMARMEVGRPGDPMPGPIVAQIREYRARLARNPRDVEALLGMGELNLQRQNPKEAIDYYKRVLDIEPENPQALASLGLILGSAGYVDEALSIFERVLARHPDDPPALWYKGWILYQVKQDYAGAIAAWERLLANSQLAPGDAEQVAVPLIEARKKLAARAAAAPGR
ncbi:MAG TPA: cytochrome c-type biogenesis protein CcmH [Casimicrobiaceae bacterium]